MCHPRSATLIFTVNMFPCSAPDIPGFGGIDYGETSLNISWTPTADGQRQQNPGHEFYIEIKKAGEYSL